MNFFKVTNMKLPIELVYQIVEISLQNDIDSCKDILIWSNNITTLKLLSLNRGMYNFIVQHPNFDKLRLWKLLCRIPRQCKPIQLAVGISGLGWTILNVEIRNERIDPTQYENFLVLEETAKVYSEAKKWNQYYLYLEQRISTKKRATQQDTTTTPIVPYFELYEFLNNLHLFTCNNLMSIWLWRRLQTFFKKDILYNMTNNNETVSGFFKPILNTQQSSLMAWDRHVLKKNGSLLRLTENVMLYNTELFGRLL